MTNSIAQTILTQLGGSRFIAMTGAKNLLNGGDYLQFDLPRGFATNKANKCRVTLNASDTYTLTFYKWNARKLELTVISEAPDLYADNLRSAFTNATGLDCTL